MKKKKKLDKSPYGTGFSRVSYIFFIFLLGTYIYKNMCICGGRGKVMFLLRKNRWSCPCPLIIQNLSMDSPSGSFHCDLHLVILEEKPLVKSPPFFLSFTLFLVHHSNAFSTPLLCIILGAHYPFTVYISNNVTWSFFIFFFFFFSSLSQ